MTLLSAINAWLSPDSSIELFYDTIMNIETAEGYGLDVWGRIVNIPRIVTLTGFGYFGFGEAGDRVGFGLGPFGDFYQTSSSNFSLQDPQYRQLILAKAAYNITNGSVPAINTILMNYLFPGRGNCWVTDGGNVPSFAFGFGEAGDRLPFGSGPFGDLLPAVPKNMTLTYVFTFPMKPVEVAIVQSGVLPKPTGVKAYWDFAGGFE